MGLHFLKQRQSVLFKMNALPDLKRRHMLKAGAGACALFAFSGAHAGMLHMHERKLSFLNLHTNERTHATYWAEGDYQADGLLAIEKVLRDHRTGEAYPIDYNLLDLLQLLQYKMGSQREFHVISGYRSPKTNEQLNAKSNGVAKRSLHMLGKAIDIRLPGHALTDLRDAALSLQAGGVGYYPGSNFIHIDTGHFRQWHG